MNSYLRTHHIVGLIEGIRVIAPGAAFERFGGRLLEHFLGVPLIHRGLNVLGHPVGGTVDTIDEAGRLAAEYSTQQGYFDGTMRKATADVLHVASLHPQANNIYLLSSQEAPIGKIDDFKSQVGKRQGFAELRLHVYDSRRIAEIIVDHLLASDTAVEQLAEYLPVLQDIRDEHAANLLAPPPDVRHVDRPAVDDEIERRLAADPCLVIWGLAGTGKSDAAAAFAARHRDDYELAIWLKGSEVGRIDDLKATPLVRGGDSRNVSSLLANRRCLVIVDDASVQLPLNELAALCRPGSHVIITQRQRQATGFELPLMSKGEAQELLNRGLMKPCPEDVWGVIWSTVRGHPLTLGLMNAAVSEGAPWSDLAEDCRAVGELQQGNQRLADRLLDRLRPALCRELAVFAWAGQPNCDRGFLRYSIQPLGLRKLEQHGLTAADRATSVRIHDVVFACLSTGDWLTAGERDRLSDALEAYIFSASTQPGLAFSTVAAGMKWKLEQLARNGDRRPAYLYALVDAWRPSEVDAGLLGDPLAAAKALNGRVGADARMEVSAVIETVEGLYRAEKVTMGIGAAKESLRSRLVIFDILGAMDGLSDRQVAEVQHHRAKALNILGEVQAALQLFEQVLAGPFPLHEARLQLIRIYARNGTTAPQAAELTDAVLTAASQPNEVSNSVVLAAVEALPWGGGQWRDKLMKQHASMIEHAILEAAEAGLDQAYQTFASVGRHWVWHDPDRFITIWEALPSKTPASATGDEECFQYGEILQLAAKARPDHAGELQAKAREFFSVMKAHTAFQAQKYGQLLVEMGRPDEAKEVLEAIRSLYTNPWALYWLSKANLDLGDAAGALQHIDMALDQLTDKAQGYVSPFRAHRYEARRILGDAGAIEDLQEAIAVCNDGKFRSALEDRLTKASRELAT